MAHSVDIIAFRGSGYTFRCECGQTDVEGFLHRAMAEDAGAKHLADVERRKYAMRGHTQTLAGAHTYYAQQAANPHIEEGQRRLWALLEKETGTRLGLYAPAEEQLEMFPAELGRRNGGDPNARSTQ